MDTLRIINDCHLKTEGPSPIATAIICQIIIPTLNDGTNDDKSSFKRLAQTILKPNTPMRFVMVSHNGPMRVFLYLALVSIQAR